MFASVTEKEPGRCAPTINDEISLECLAKGVSRLIVVASDLDGLRQFVEGRIEPFLDGVVELGVDEGFAICSRIQQSSDFKRDATGGELDSFCRRMSSYDM